MKFTIDLVTRNIRCKELTVKQYKEILKATWPETPSVNPALDTLFDIFADLSNVDFSHFYNFNLIEIFIYLIELKIQTSGNICMLSVSDADGKSANLSLNLRTVQETIKNTYNSILNQTTKTDQIEIKLAFPTIQRLLDSKEDTDDYLLYVAGATILSNNVSIVFSSTNEVETFIDSLPLSLVKQIQIAHQNFHIKINEINFLSSFSVLGEQRLPFVLTFEYFIWFVKLLFAEPLDVLYDNMYYLSNLGRIDLGYLESCTPGEYTYFVKKLEQSLNAEQSSSDSNYDDTVLPEDYE